MTNVILNPIIIWEWEVSVIDQPTWVFHTFPIPSLLHNLAYLIYWSNVLRRKEVRKRNGAERSGGRVQNPKSALVCLWAARDGGCSRSIN